MTRRSMLWLAGAGLRGQSRWRVDQQWPPVPAGVKWGRPSAVAIDREGNLLILQRGEPALLRFDPAGKLIQSWSKGFFKMAHGLKIAPDGNIWTTDSERHVVVKFAPDGRQLRMIGTPDVEGQGPTQFGGVADIAFLPSGDFFVADGYRNSRIVKFDRDGKYIAQWGKKGTGAGEFDLPHAVAVDGSGRVYVGDRENKRIQIFDSKGNYLSTWTAGSPYGLC
ncbi:MAG: peptidyl-alpha-hydroxyglycine alpha-amidating lyase family protein, partial [Bryobacteraceae bacterium]